MYLEEERTIEAVLRATLEARTGDLRLKLVDRFREQGYEALAVGKEPRPDAPSVDKDGSDFQHGSASVDPVFILYPF